MGALWSMLWPPRSAEFINDPSLDVPDPTTGLSPRQKLVIKENWTLVKSNVQQNGIDLFLAIFKSYPSYQLFFKSFANVPQEELPANKKLLAHSINVMYAITSLVDCIDDVGSLNELLLKTGENHGRRKIGFTEFQNVFKVIVDVLEEKLGEKFTSFARVAWEDAFKVMITLINQGVQQTWSSE